MRRWSTSCGRPSRPSSARTWRANWGRSSPYARTVCGEALRSRSRWRRKAAISACTSGPGEGGERSRRGLPLAQPGLESFETAEGPLRQCHPPARLVADALRQLGEQAERDVRRLVVFGVAACDVAAERSERGVLREGDGL